MSAVCPIGILPRARSCICELVYFEDALEIKDKVIIQVPEEIPEDRWAYLRLMFDMMVLAYWTDSTRVATFMLDHEQSNRFFDFPGVKGMWHSISHWRNISGNDEEGVSWSKSMSFMLPDIDGWIINMLQEAGYQEISVIGRNKSIRSNIERSLFLATK